MVDVCLLGCGGGMPMPFRNLSATLINFKGRKILVDCGEGTQVSMRMVGWGFKTLDVICITHCHGDHIVGLPGLLSTIGNSGREEPLTIVGPSGITDVIKGLRVIAHYLPYDINIIENPKSLNFNLDKNIISISKNSKQVFVKTLQVDHSSPCLAYSFVFARDRKFSVESALKNGVPKILWSKLQKGESVLYEGKEFRSDLVLGESRKGIKLSLVTDSRPLEEMFSFVCDSDLFICEGTYGKEEDLEKAIRNKHMIFREAANIAREGHVKELLLTHFTPAMIEPQEYLNNAREVFSNTVVGYDRCIKQLKFQNE